MIISISWSILVSSRCPLIELGFIPPSWSELDGRETAGPWRTTNSKSATMPVATVGVAWYRLFEMEDVKEPLGKGF